MNPRHRVLPILATIALAVSACSPSTTSSQGPTNAATTVPATPGPTVVHQTFSIPSFEPAAVRWYCCLGTGEDPTQKPTEEKIAAGFAEKYPGSSLKLEITTYDSAVSHLSTQIGPNPPDIAGPVGVSGLASFKGQWLDLAPYLQSSNYDLSVYDPKTLEFLQQDAVQIGVPFDLYPSMLWYKTDFFEEAGLEEPPHEFGAKYKMPDGTEVEWNYETLRQIALKLTVDSNGKDATEAGFDPTKIEQFGFEPQRDSLPSIGAFFGAGSLVGSDGKTVTVPDPWAAGWKFVYDAIWKDHITMTEAQFNNDKIGGGDQAFFSGRVAMGVNFLWTTYGVADDAVTDWDLAAIPSYNGKITAPLNADTFAIIKNSKHQDAAFAAMVYLLQDKSNDLLPLYGGMPARQAEQDAFLQQLAATKGFPADVDWAVAKDAIAYADIPNFEAWIPKNNETTVILQKYRSRWTTTPGLDMDQQIEALRVEIQAAWDAS
jgi:multiple sugar transport system substrate-binding protein